jgi:hypothetical protein
MAGNNKSTNRTISTLEPNLKNTLYTNHFDISPLGLGTTMAKEQVSKQNPVPSPLSVSEQGINNPTQKPSEQEHTPAHFPSYTEPDYAQAALPSEPKSGFHKHTLDQRKLEDEGLQQDIQQTRTKLLEKRTAEIADLEVLIKALSNETNQHELDSREALRLKHEEEVKRLHLEFGPQNVKELAKLFERQHLELAEWRSGNEQRFRDITAEIIAYRNNIEKKLETEEQECEKYIEEYQRTLAAKRATEDTPPMGLPPLPIVRRRKPAEHVFTVKDIGGLKHNGVKTSYRPRHWNSKLPQLVLSRGGVFHLRDGKLGTEFAGNPEWRINVDGITKFSYDPTTFSIFIERDRRVKQGTKMWVQFAGEKDFNAFLVEFKDACLRRKNGFRVVIQEE